MDYGQAKRIGDAAEQLVADILQGLQFEHQFAVLNDVLIAKRTGRGLITAQLDHVVIDQSGVLVIETKARNGALLRGTYADKNWTAIYSAGKKQTFQNPLKQNEQHLNLLHQILRDTGFELPLDRVRGLVVIAGADVSALELDSVSALRIATPDGLAQSFADRNSFMFATPLVPSQQSELAGAIRGLDRSNDPEVMSAHARYRQGGSAPAAPHKPARAPRSSPSTPSQRPSYHSAAPNRSLGQAINEALRLLMLRLVVTVLTLAIGYFALMWGIQSFISGWTTAGTPSGMAPPAAGTLAARPSIDAAKRALKDADPDRYSKLVNPDSPSLSERNGYPAYTWDYLVEKDNQSVAVNKITIILDQEGRPVGFSRD